MTMLPEMASGHRTVGVLLCTVLLIGSAACTSGNGDPDATEEPTRSGDAPYDEPEDDGEISIVDYGLTDLGEVPDGHVVALGVVLENTSQTDIAGEVSVSYQLRDAEGDAVLNPDTQKPDFVGTVRAVQPGDRGAFGENRAYVAGPGASEITNLSIDEVQWWASPDEQFPKVTAEDISVELDGSDATVSFTVHSEAEEHLAPGHGQGMVIFRDSDDAIVGGIGGAVAGTGGYPPGESTDELLVPGVPENVDPDKTDIYATSAY